MDVAIVLLPLLGALIAGLGNRRLGDTPAQWITSGFMLISCVLAWVVFIQAARRLFSCPSSTVATSRSRTGAPLR